MLQFLLDNDIDVHAKLIERNRNQQVVCYLPFSNKDKMKIVARIKPSYEWKGEEPEVYIVIQGAPEFIHMHCSQTYNQDSQD